MTVAELVEILRAAPGDALVLVTDQCGDVVDLAVRPVFAVDDGTGIYAVRDEPKALERWRDRNAKGARIAPALVLESEADNVDEED